MQEEEITELFIAEITIAECNKRYLGAVLGDDSVCRKKHFTKFLMADKSLLPKKIHWNVQHLPHDNYILHFAGEIAQLSLHKAGVIFCDDKIIHLFQRMQILIFILPNGAGVSRRLNAAEFFKRRGGKAECAAGNINLLNVEDIRDIPYTNCAYSSHWAGSRNV